VVDFEHNGRRLLAAIAARERITFEDFESRPNADSRCRTSQT
jgi:hypothetical protein